MALGSLSSTSPMPLPEPAPFTPRRFTVEEYRQMGELGVLTEDDNVELLEGVITPKMMHNPPHDAAIMKMDEALRPFLPVGWSIRIQSSMATADSEPEPDLAIVRGRASDYVRRHPVGKDMGLVIEVADSSLMRDRHKARIYARAEAPAYWIVNLNEEQIEVFTQPSSPGDESGYRQSAVYRRGDSVPVQIPDSIGAEIPVDDLLP